MIKHFCDHCHKHIVFFSEEPRRFSGTIGETKCVIDAVLHYHGDERELCDPCFNELLDNIYAEHSKEVLQLRADKAKGFSVPDA